MIYFIESFSDNRIKIGHSIDPTTRLKSLGTSHSEPIRFLLVIPGGIKRENKIHLEFKKFHVRGEWFEASYELKNYIDQYTSCESNHCRVCGINYLSKPDIEDIREHSHIHREISEGAFPYNIRELMKSIAWQMLANIGGKIEIDAWKNEDDIKRVIAYAWWAREKQSGFDNIHFDDYILDCMEYLDVRCSKEMQNLHEVEKRMNCHWGDRWPIQ